MLWSSLKKIPWGDSWICNDWDASKNVLGVHICGKPQPTDLRKWAMLMSSRYKFL